MSVLKPVISSALRGVVNPAVVQIGSVLNLAEPTMLELTTLSETSIELNWLNPIENFDGIKIYRSLDNIAFNEIHDINDVSTETYIDTNLNIGTKYYYLVKAYRGNTVSQYSLYRNVLVLGNSITYYPELYAHWWGYWGMAASQKKYDFVHVLESKLQILNRNVNVEPRHIAAWEADHENYDLSNFDEYFTTSQDLVVIRLGENISSTTNLDTSLQDLIDYIKLKAPSSRIILTGVWMTSAIKDTYLNTAAINNALTYTELSSLYTDENKSKIGNVVYGEDGQTHIITDAAVAGHPGDLGMANIADKIYEKVIPSTTTRSDFTMVFNTENAGSASKTIIIPTSGSGFDFTIDWGDGLIEDYSGSPGNISHLYSSTGDKTVKITGLFPYIKFDGGGDCLKLIDITNWGNIVWGNFTGAFKGCSNLVCSATDLPDLSQVTQFYVAFTDCSAFNGNIGAWNVSNIINFSYGFYGCTSLNQDVSLWNISSGTALGRLFGNCSNMNPDMSGWDISNVTDMTGMLANTNHSTVNYDAMLIAWSQLTVKSGVNFQTSAKYSSSSSDERAILIGTINNWNITDGGVVS